MIIKKFLLPLLILAVSVSWVAGATANATAVEPGTQKIEKERVEFVSLISQNRNYFGTILNSKLKVFKPMKMRTTYEELRNVGLYPADNLLEAVFRIKLPYGFSGKLCKAGSNEYIAFYIDYGDGSGFVSVGAPAIVNVHDLAKVSKGFVYYAAKKAFNPKLLSCTTPQIVKVRAILSWQDPPTGPDFIPVWGNRMEKWVQIKPRYRFLYFPGLILKSVLPNFIAEATGITTAKKTEPAMTAADEKMMLVGTKEEIKDFIKNAEEMEAQLAENPGKLEKERFEFKKLISKNLNYFGSITKSKKPEEIKYALAKLPLAAKKQYLQWIGSFAELQPYFPMWYNTSYEELKGLGLYPEEDLLEAVIEIKRDYGYSGSLCPPGGSYEYVSFYIDWGSGSFGVSPVATAKVRVYDIPGTSGKHLYYAVNAKIPDKVIKSHLMDCNTENIVRVKAILSWNIDPSGMGPGWHPPYGNVITRRVQLRPTTGESLNCEIQTVNDIIVEHINQVGSDQGLALNPDSTISIIRYDKPFGGIISVHGKINVPGANYYRFLYSENNGASWTPVLDPLRYPNPTYPFPFGSEIYYELSPDANGFIDISAYDTQKTSYDPLALIYWNSGGKNSLCKLKLEVSSVANPFLMPLQADEIYIQLDNIAPALLDFSDAPFGLPASGLLVKNSSDTPMECQEFLGQNEIRVFGNFYDEYFNGFDLNVFGGNIHPAGEIFGRGSYSSISGTGTVEGRYLPPPPATISSWRDIGLGGNIYSGGINGADSNLTPSSGQQIGTLTLCHIPTYHSNVSHVKCAYGISLYITDRAIVGHWGSMKYNHSTTCHALRIYVTFNWDPTGSPACQ